MAEQTLTINTLAATVITPSDVSQFSLDDIAPNIINGGGGTIVDVSGIVTLASQVAELDSEVTVLQTNVADLQEDVSGLDAAVAQAQTTATSAASTANAAVATANSAKSTAQYALKAGTAQYALKSSTAQYALKVGTAQYALEATTLKYEDPYGNTNSLKAKLDETRWLAFEDKDGDRLPISAASATSLEYATPAGITGYINASLSDDQITFRDLNGKVLSVAGSGSGGDVSELTRNGETIVSVKDGYPVFYASPDEIKLDNGTGPSGVMSLADTILLYAEEAISSGGGSSSGGAVSELTHNGSAVISVEDGNPVFYRDAEQIQITYGTTRYSLKDTILLYAGSGGGSSSGGFEGSYSGNTLDLTGTDTVKISSKSSMITLDSYPPNEGPSGSVDGVLAARAYSEMWLLAGGGESSNGRIRIGSRIYNDNYLSAMIELSGHSELAPNSGGRVFIGSGKDVINGAAGDKHGIAVGAGLDYSTFQVYTDEIEFGTPDIPASVLFNGDANEIYISGRNVSVSGVRGLTLKDTILLYAGSGGGGAASALQYWAHKDASSAWGSARLIIDQSSKTFQFYTGEGPVLAATAGGSSSGGSVSELTFDGTTYLSVEDGYTTFKGDANDIYIKGAAGPSGVTSLKDTILMYAGSGGGSSSDGFDGNFTGQVTLQTTDDDTFLKLNGTWATLSGGENVSVGYKSSSNRISFDSSGISIGEPHFWGSKLQVYGFNSVSIHKTTAQGIASALSPYMSGGSGGGSTDTAQYALYAGELQPYKASNWRGSSSGLFRDAAGVTYLGYASKQPYASASSLEVGIIIDPEGDGSTSWPNTSITILAPEQLNIRTDKVNLNPVTGAGTYLNVGYFETISIHNVTAQHIADELSDYLSGGSGGFNGTYTGPVTLHSSTSGSKSTLRLDNSAIALESLHLKLTGPGGAAGARLDIANNAEFIFIDSASGGTSLKDTILMYAGSGGGSSSTGYPALTAPNGSSLYYGITSPYSVEGFRFGSFVDGNGESPIATLKAFDNTIDIECFDRSSTSLAYGLWVQPGNLRFGVTDTENTGELRQGVYIPSSPGYNDSPLYVGAMPSTSQVYGLMAKSSIVGVGNTWYDSSAHVDTGVLVNIDTTLVQAKSSDGEASLLLDASSSIATLSAVFTLNCKDTTLGEADWAKLKQLADKADELLALLNQ